MVCHRRAESARARVDIDVDAAVTVPPPPRLVAEPSRAPRARERGAATRRTAPVPDALHIAVAWPQLRPPHGSHAAGPSRARAGNAHAPCPRRARLPSTLRHAGDMSVASRNATATRAVARSPLAPGGHRAVGGARGGAACLRVEERRAAGASAGRDGGDLAVAPSDAAAAVDVAAAPGAPAASDEQ